MIVAAGLSPAWQQMVTLPGLALGAVNRASEARWSASGKVLNVGLALHHLGAEVCTVSPVGGLEGRQIDAEFEALGIRRRWVWTAARTRVCTTLLDTTSGETTEVVENALEVSPQELDAFLATYAEVAEQAALVVLSGSLPSGTPPALYSELLARTPGRALLDFRGAELLEALSHRPFLVKPNREELAQTVGRSLDQRADIVAAMDELRTRGAEWVVVTDGPGEVLACGPDGVFGFRSLRLDVVNPIGCGDCLCAAIAWALERGRSMPEAVSLGIAAAAENARMMLPGRLDAARVEALAARVERTE